MINKFKISTPEIVVLTPTSEARAVGLLHSLGGLHPRNYNSIPGSDKSFHLLQNVHTVSVTHPAGHAEPIWTPFSGNKAAGT
jgi:hypothetical protein